jgi:hypothetical protein
MRSDLRIDSRHLPTLVNTFPGSLVPDLYRMTLNGRSIKTCGATVRSSE